MQLFLLPLALSARLLRKPVLARTVIAGLALFSGRETALDLAVTCMDTASDEGGAVWVRDHVVPESLRGEAWNLYTGAVAL